MDVQQELARSGHHRLPIPDLIISDIDGCLTDGKVYYADGTEIEKSFSIQDDRSLFT